MALTYSCVKINDRVFLSEDDDDGWVNLYLTMSNLQSNTPFARIECSILNTISTHLTLSEQEANNLNFDKKSDRRDSYQKVIQPYNRALRLRERIRKREYRRRREEHKTENEQRKKDVMNYGDFNLIEN
jgi:hypothetical protein